MKKPTISILVAVLAALFSVPASASQLLNISTRLNVGKDENVLIGGFIVTGAAPKRVIARGIGPSLSDFEVDFALEDPVLELHQLDGTVTTNDNWRDTEEQEIIDTGLAPTNDLESAIVATLDPGPYTVIVRSKDESNPDLFGFFGTALVEVYDLDEGADSRLANISTRGFVDTAQVNYMIAGVITGGDASDATIVVRALGPSLGELGILGFLGDPRIELHNEAGDDIGANDNWQDDPLQAAEIEAAGLAPGNDLESAFKVTLPPGLYTAVMSGTSDGTIGTGVGLVEIYHLE